MKSFISLIVTTLLLSSSAWAQAKPTDLMSAGMPSQLAVLVAGGVSAEGDHILGTDLDAQRKLTFGATSDTALSLTFGDGGTDDQLFGLTSQSANGFDDDTIIISGGGGGSATDNGRGAYLQIQGNEASSGGDLILSTGAAVNSVLTLDAAAAAGTIVQQVAGSTKFTINATGELIGAGTATLGWTVVAGANTACSTTCVTPCVFGVNTAATEADIVACSDPTADECLCAGAS